MNQPKRDNTTPPPDPLFFLTPQQRSNYADDILEVLEQYPAKHKSADRAALALLSVHFHRMAPGHACRSRTAKWLKDHRYEMVIAALVICSQQTEVGNPFNYCEGILKRWKQPGLVVRQFKPRRQGPDQAPQHAEQRPQPQAQRPQEPNPYDEGELPDDAPEYLKELLHGPRPERAREAIQEHLDQRLDHLKKEENNAAEDEEASPT